MRVDSQTAVSRSQKSGSEWPAISRIIDSSGQCESADPPNTGVGEVCGFGFSSVSYRLMRARPALRAIGCFIGRSVRRCFSLSITFMFLCLSWACGTNDARSGADRMVGVPIDGITADDGPMMSEVIAVIRATIDGNEQFEGEEYDALREQDIESVIVTLYQPGMRPTPVIGAGSNILESAVDAAHKLMENDPQLGSSSMDTRIKIDVPSSAWLPHWDLEKRILSLEMEEVGLSGISVIQGKNTGLLTPSEIVERDLYNTEREGLRRRRLFARLEERCDCEISNQSTLVAFQTLSWVESADKTHAIQLERLHLTQRPELSPALIDDRIELTADFLTRRVADDDLDLVIHAQIAHVLLATYRRTGSDVYLDAARVELDRLRNASQFVPLNGPWGAGYRIIVQEKNARTDLAGLALIAYAEYVDATGDRSSLPWMQQVGRSIGWTLTHHRLFPSHVPFRSRGTPRYDKSRSNLGQAAYGLFRLYMLDHQNQYLTWISQLLHIVLVTTDGGKSLDMDRVDDLWLMGALVKLYEETRVDLAAEEAMSRARGINIELRSNPSPAYSDLVGAVDHPPYYTGSVASRLAALYQVLDLANQESTMGQFFRTRIEEGLSWLLLHQYTEDSGFFLSDPSHDMGGLPQDLTDPETNPEAAIYLLHVLLEYEIEEGAG